MVSIRLSKLVENKKLFCYLLLFFLTNVFASEIYAQATLLDGLRRLQMQGYSCNDHSEYFRCTQDGEKDIFLKGNKALDPFQKINHQEGDTIQENIPAGEEPDFSEPDNTPYEA